MITTLVFLLVVVILFGVFLAFWSMDQRVTRLEARTDVLKLEVRGHRHDKPRTLSPRCETGEPAE